MFQWTFYAYLLVGSFAVFLLFSVCLGVSAGRSRSSLRLLERDDVDSGMLAFEYAKKLLERRGLSEVAVDCALGSSRYSGRKVRLSVNVFDSAAPASLAAAARECSRAVQFRQEGLWLAPALGALLFLLFLSCSAIFAPWAIASFPLNILAPYWALAFCVVAVAAFSGSWRLESDACGKAAREIAFDFFASRFVLRSADAALKSSARGKLCAELSSELFLAFGCLCAGAAFGATAIFFTALGALVFVRALYKLRLIRLLHPRRDRFSFFPQ